jgi:Putative  PD-(D/E)XK family member, (DUF4420)
MLENNWDANDVYTILETPRQHNFGSDITVLRMDGDLQVVIGYKEDGSVFFGCPQNGDIKGFKKGRAKLDVMQSIDLKERGTVEPALALSFLINSEEELRAISTIFSGLYDLNRNAPGSEKATLAAQGFEDYFTDLPKIRLTGEIETGLFGELSIIAASENKDALVKGWHSSPDATYDFSFGGNRLEVKTSTRPTRLVWLRSSQTLRSVDANLTYLSIFAPIDEAGMTLDELAGKIRTSLSEPLKSIFDEKLSYYEIANSSRRFDYLTAVNSFRFILASDVPVPTADDPQILELRWKCSFENIVSAGNQSKWL